MKSARSLRPSLYVWSLLFLTSTTGTAQERFAITPVTVVDVTGGSLHPHRTVLIEDDRIARIGPADELSVPTGARVVDGAGGYLIPGLWDMHVHLASDSIIPPLHLFTAFGVTAVRDVGGDRARLQNLTRQRVSAPLTLPRVYICGPQVDPDSPASDGRTGPSGPLQDLSTIDSVLSPVVDCIKAYEPVEPAVLALIVKDAGARWLPVAVHPSPSVTMRVASQLGVRSVEHLHLGNGDIEGISLHDQQQQQPLWDRQTLLWKQVDPRSDAARDLVDILLRYHTYLTPTLTIDEGNMLLSDMDQALDPQNAVLPEAILRAWKGQATAEAPNVSPELSGGALTAADARRRFVREASRAGVPLLAGSGGPWLGTYLPGLGLHHELALLVQAGVSPLDALRAATLHPAEFFAASAFLGTVEVGKVADLVLLDANPLENIANTKRIRAVVAAGRLYTREDLYRLVADTEVARRTDH